MREFFVCLQISADSQEEKLLTKQRKVVDQRGENEHIVVQAGEEYTGRRVRRQRRRRISSVAA